MLEQTLTHGNTHGHNINSAGQSKAVVGTTRRMARHSPVCPFSSPGDSFQTAVTVRSPTRTGRTFREHRKPIASQFYLRGIASLAGSPVTGRGHLFEEHCCFVGVESTCRAKGRRICGGFSIILASCYFSLILFFSLLFFLLF